ncbi:hypothetical protein GGX14DRAFT_393378 [Mycena pura]|uniref:Uncharacterized protein n=1 Tax=Mycena pura TaxID=153505 RepID=A0AAD6VLG4_9AGAR|nr:hypothetical protein GGX14DRAFT_393378 [Mycena pura]
MAAEPALLAFILFYPSSLQALWGFQPGCQGLLIGRGPSRAPIPPVGKRAKLPKGGNTNPRGESSPFNVGIREPTPLPSQLPALSRCRGRLYKHCVKYIKRKQRKHTRSPRRDNGHISVTSWPIDMNLGGVLKVGIMCASFQACTQMIASVSAFRITKIHVNRPGNDGDMAVVASGSNQTSEILVHINYIIYPNRGRNDLGDLCLTLRVLRTSSFDNFDAAARASRGHVVVIVLEYLSLLNTEAIWVKIYNAK